MKKAVLLAAGLLAAPMLVAKDIDEQYAVFSVGGDPCSDYLAARQTGAEPEQRYLHWIAGYLSAFNQIVPGTYNILGQRDFGSFLGELDAYCREHRDELLVAVLSVLAERMYPDRLNLSPNKDNRDKWRTNPLAPDKTEAAP